MENSVAEVKGQFCQKLELEEVNTLVRTFETNVQAGRDRLRDHQEKFEILQREIQLLQMCESAGFLRNVPLDNTFKTIHDEDDRFGGTTGACREYT